MINFFRKTVFEVIGNNPKKTVSGMCQVTIIFLIELLIPIINMKIIDEGIMKYEYNIFLSLILILFASYFLKFLLELISNKIFVNFANILNQNLNKRAYQSLLKNKAEYFNENKQGDILEKLSEIEMLEFFLSPDIISWLYSLFLGLVCAIIIGYYNYVILFVLLVFLLLYFLNMIYWKKKISNIAADYYEKNSKLSSIYSETIMGMEEIHNYQAEHYFEEKVSQHIEQKIEIKEKFEYSKNENITFSTYLASLFSLGMLFVIGKQIIEGNLTIGTYILILSLSEKVLVSFINSVSIVQQFSEIKIVVARFNSLFDNVDKNIETNISNDKFNPLSILQLHLNVENISFKYHSQKNNIINDLNIKAKTGEVIKIVGENGVGKSTLFKLLLSKYSVTSGKITINEDDIRKSSCMVRILPQHPIVFNLSLKENIFLGKKDSQCLYNYEEIIEMLSLEKLFGRKKIYSDDPIGESNKKNSGGQIKIIAFARLLCENFSGILLFDEILAGLDEEYAEIIKKNIEILRKRNIILIIEHSDKFDELITETINIKYIKK